MFRIRKSEVVNLGPGVAPAVLLMHGLGMNADIWIGNGLGREFAYMLVNEGYDVWVANSRGTTYTYSSLNCNPNFK
jgi:lysosomal acid lipase/cholesteryl ester hydrolase